MIQLLYFLIKTKVIAERLSVELSSCKRWLVDNRLSLHVGKTRVFALWFKEKVEGEWFPGILWWDTCWAQVYRKVSGRPFRWDCQWFCPCVQSSNLMKVCAGRLTFLYRPSSLLDKHNKAGFTTIQSRTVWQEQKCESRLELKNVTDGPTYQPTSRPTRQGVESRVRD